MTIKSCFYHIALSTVNTTYICMYCIRSLDVIQEQGLLPTYLKSSPLHMYKLNLVQ